MDNWIIYFRYCICNYMFIWLIVMLHAFLFAIVYVFVALIFKILNSIRDTISLTGPYLLHTIFE